VTPGQIVHM